MFPGMKLMLGFLIGLSVLFFSGNGLAMQKLAEEEMDGIVAGSFSRFSMETDANDISRATVEVNIHAEMYASVDNFRAHYRPIYHTGEPDDILFSEWDQDWEGVTYGASIANPLKFEHFVLEAEFAEFDTNARTLLSVKMGFQTVNGLMTIDDLRSFTGTYGGENHFRINPAHSPYPGDGAGFVFENDPMFIIFDARGWMGEDIPVDPPNYRRGGHNPADFENEAMVRFDFGNAMRNIFPDAPPAPAPEW